jgi:hypothetical protein
MSDNGIPLSFVDNHELPRWSLHSNVVLDTEQGQLEQFVDAVATDKLFHGCLDEPLFRLRMTRLTQNGEWIMGTSWAHVLGDAFACIKFLNTLSRFYQQLEPLEPFPVFERRLWDRVDADRSLLPFIKHWTDALTADQIFEQIQIQQLTHDQINVQFSGEQLVQLYTLVDNKTLTIHDVMIAYIILTLNTQCFENIEHTNTIVNFRGVYDTIASAGLIANCTLRMLSENFDDPYSLLSIAKDIRHSIIWSRDPLFLQPLLPTNISQIRICCSRSTGVQTKAYL